MPKHVHAWRSHNKLPVTMQLTIQQFTDYLSAKGVKRECDQCGKESWAFIDQPDANTVWAIDSRRIDGSQTMPSPGIPCVAMCCNHCSFIKLFASMPIESWVKQREDVKK